ncbi:hypothetical protein EJK15_60045 [Nonomuraea basaltis]|nr:hypothetical protein EJK15_60045 [Nonomuraea basaltis]
MGWFPRRWAAPVSPSTGAAHFRARPPLWEPDEPGNLRKAAPEVLATARAQRWDPAEVVRVLWHCTLSLPPANRRHRHDEVLQIRCAVA